MMTLALRMGRTLSELDQVLTEREFLLWEAYDAMSPIGDIRRDIYDAQIAAAVFQSRGAKLSFNDLLIPWGQAAPAAPEEEFTDDGLPVLTPSAMKQLGAGRPRRK